MVIIDDSKNLLHVYKKFFRVVGIRVIQEFSDVKDALRYFQIDNKSDDSIVLLDHGLPVMNGFEIARQLKMLKPRLKIILSTAEEASELNSERNLFAGIIRKPFTISDFLDVIEKVSSPLQMKGSWIFRDTDEILNLLREILYDSKEKLCSVRTPASIIVGGVAGHPPPYIEARAKGLKIFLITEITRDNLFYCKRLMVDQGVNLRHIDHVESTFAVWDEKHTVEVAIAPSKVLPAGQIMYGNLEQIVSKNQRMFDNLWSIAKPAEEKIRELESNKEKIGELKAISGVQDNLQARIHIINNATSTFDACYDSNIALNLFSFEIREALTAASKRGVKLRHITEITKENLHTCEELIQIGVELRHLSGIIGGFAVNDTEFDAKASNDPLDSESIYSNQPDFVEQHKSIFNTLWTIAIPALSRMGEIRQEQDDKISKGLSSIGSEARPEKETS